MKNHVVAACLFPLAACLVLIATSVPARGQTSESAAPQSELQTLDLPWLLTQPQVMTEEVDDPIWNLQAGEGRILVQLPIRFAPVQTPTAIEDPVYSLSASRFVVWRLPSEREVANFQRKPTQHNRSQSSAHIRLLADPASPQHTPESQRAAIDAVLLTDTSYAPAASSSHEDDASVSDDTVGSRATSIAPPEDAPQLTREFTLHSDGRVTWELERVVPGADVSEGDKLYHFKLNPSQLRDKQPQRPQRPQYRDGQDRREYREKVREMERDYREKAQAYRDLADQVRDLDETFAIAKPPIIWAIYEIPARLRDIEFEGPAPYPWELEAKQFEQLRELAASPPTGRRSEDNALSDEQRQAVALLNNITQSNQAVALEAAAFVVNRMDLVATMPADGPAYQLVERIITGPSQPARSRLIGSLSSVLPPTDATAKLMPLAAKRMTAHEQLIALQGMLNASLDSDASQQLMLTLANQALTDAQGPDVSQVLTVLTSQAGDNAALQDALAQQVAFEQMPDDRLEDAIAFVARYAAARPMVARWLQENLLQSGKTISPTLEVLHRDLEGRLTVAGLSPGEPVAVGPWPVFSAKDGLLAALQGSDEAIREKAWAVLPGFAFAPEVLTENQLRSTSDENADAVSIVVQTGLDQQPTPSTLVPFLAAQDEEAESPSPRITVALLRIAGSTRADKNAVQQAAKALVGSGRDLDEAAKLAELTAEKRERIARQTYAVDRGVDADKTPVILGLVRDPQMFGPYADIIVQQSRSEQLTSESLACALGDEDDFLKLTSSDDPQLAEAAVAGLVLLEGGDESSTQTLAEEFAKLAPDDREAKKQLWAEARQQIHAKQFEQAAGRYNVLLTPRVADEQPSDEDETNDVDANEPSDDDASAKQPMVLGLVDMQSADGVMQLNNGIVLTPASDRMVLLIEEPTALTMFTVPALAELSLNEVSAPIELHPQVDGTWQATFETPDGTTWLLTMTPAK